MIRREFITLLGGAATVWPLASRAQQREMLRRIVVLMRTAPEDPETQARVLAFAQALQQLGWTVGDDNVRIDIRSDAGDDDRLRRNVAEMVALAPDVILAVGNSTMMALRQTSRSMATVFTQVVDPVGAGFATSLARPGGNATGFTMFEFGISAKWLELLKQIAPNVTRAAIIKEGANPGAVGQLGAIQSVAPFAGIELSLIEMLDMDEVERAVTAFARGSNGGLIVLSGPAAIVHRDLIVTLAARHRLPAVYPYRFYATSGGLISYGPDSIDPFRRAAGYVDRVLKGEKPADLPVQAPTKYELVLNLKTARALALDVPASVLARADEVIE
jgi:putative ABC transport system substrate-binding protein